MSKSKINNINPSISELLAEQRALDIALREKLQGLQTIPAPQSNPAALPEGGEEKPPVEEPPVEEPVVEQPAVKTTKK